MEPLQKTKLFENDPIPKAVFSLTVPTVISSLVMVLYNLADTYFVGMLNDPLQNAAVTLAAPVLLAFNAVNNLFGVGCSSMMSRALGKKDYQTVRRTAAFGFWCALLCGALFSLLCTVFRAPLLTLLGARRLTWGPTLGYMKWTVFCGAAPAILNVVLAQMVRSEGAALHASVGTMSGCLLNIILDPFFILPRFLGMGAAGAGLATFLSNCAACLYFLLLLFAKRKQTFISLRLRIACFEKGIVFGVFAVGIPAAIQNLLNVTGMTVLNQFTAGYSESAVAAMGIANKIAMIPMYVAMGISQGIMPLISYNYAAQNISRMKKALLFAARLAMLFMGAATALYFVFSEPLTRLFIENQEVVAYGAAFLRGLCLAQPFLCLDFLAVGVFQACGMGKKALVFALLRKLVLEIPALFILDRLFPLYGLAYAQLCAEAVLACAAVIVLIHLFAKLQATEKPAT